MSDTILGLCDPPEPVYLDVGSGHCGMEHPDLIAPGD